MKFKKSEVSLAYSLTLKSNSCGKSLMWTRKKRRPKIEHCETPASIRDHFDDWALRETTMFPVVLK